MTNQFPYPQLRAGRDEPILEPDLPIIDSAHHLFDRPALRYMFDDYLADVRAGHKIVASIYVETLAFARRDGPELLRPLGEVEFANGIGAMSASGAYGDCRICAAIVGFADLRFGEEVGQLLDQALALAPERFRGVRQITIEAASDAPFRYVTNRPAPGLMRHPKFHAGLREVARRGLTFDAAAFHHQLDDVAELADKFPDLPIVLNHVGQGLAMELDAQGRTGVLATLRQSLKELGQAPQHHLQDRRPRPALLGFRPGAAHRSDRLPRTRRRLAPLRGGCHRSLRRRPLHDGKQLPARRPFSRLRAAVERPEAHRA